MPEQLFLNWDRVPAKYLRLGSQSYLHYLLLRLTRLLGFSIGRVHLGTTWADERIVISESLLPPELKEQTELVLERHPEERFVVVGCYRFHTQEPHQPQFGVAFLSADGLVGLLVIWIPILPDQFYYSCTSQHADRTQWIVTFGRGSLLGTPLHWIIAIASRNRLASVLSLHRSRLEKLDVVPMPKNDVTSIIVNLNNEHIDHNLDIGILELWNVD